MKKFFVIVAFIILIKNQHFFCNNSTSTSKSFLLSIYLKQIDLLIETHQFSQARKSLLVLESIYPMNSMIEEKTKELIIKDYQETYLKNIYLTEEELAWTGDVHKCKAGTISKIAKDKTLTILNYFRRLAGISDNCQFVESINNICQETAFILYVNEILTHYIDESYKCYTPLANEGALRSNLSYNSIGPLAIKSQIFDDGFFNYSVAHRRWIFNPFNSKFGIGIAPKTTALGVFGKDTENNWYEFREFYESKKFVAWPSSGFFPCELLPNRWSFSLNNAKFEKAKVTVNKYKNGKKIPLKIKIQPIEEDYGLNTIVWEIEDEWDNNKEAIYEVEIKNVYLKKNFSDDSKEGALNFSYKVNSIQCESTTMIK